jgi:hypothetical protein
VKLGIGLVLGSAILTALSLVVMGLCVVVMGLWNALVPAIFHGPTIGFWQAAGLLVLSRILFGGWPGRGARWRHHRLSAGWQSMTPEERQRLRERLGRCGWGPAPDATQPPP